MLTALVLSAAAAGAFLIVRRGKERPKKKRIGTAVPAEPTLPGQVVTWHRSYYTIVVEKEDTPELAPPFAWGVIDTEALRRATPAGAAVPAFQEAMAAGMCFGLGTAETYDEAVRESQMWADTIREPLEQGETLAFAIDGVLLVVAPKARAHPTDPPVRWMVYAFTEASWPQWATGELPGPNDAIWQMEELSQDGALGQGVLYARTNGTDAAPAPDPEVVQVGATAANSGQEIVWSGRPGASCLIAVGRRNSGRRAASPIRGLAIGAQGHSGQGHHGPAHGRIIVRRARRGGRVLRGGHRPPLPRWIGESAIWWHRGIVLVLERTALRGARAFAWSAFDPGGLEQTGWDFLIATARGYRLGFGFASSPAVAIRDAQAFVSHKYANVRSYR